ncbi:MAG: preprotein translocase subunit SecE [Pirellulaceae bacterium]
MAKQASASNSFLKELFQFNFYKRNQGRISRQVTFGAVFVAVALGSWGMVGSLEGRSYGAYVYYGVPIALVAMGFWFSFRLVNYSKFADFLIAVEAEMNKVTWPSRELLVRGSMVVIFVIFFMAFLLFGFDMLWKFLFRLMGVLQDAAPVE